MLAVIADRHPRGQRLVADLGMLPLIRAQLPHVSAVAAGRSSEAQAAGVLAQWLALALGKLVEDAPDASTFPDPVLHVLCSARLTGVNLHVHDADSDAALHRTTLQCGSRVGLRLQLAEAAMVEDMPHVLEALLDAPNPELRASAAFALGSLLTADRPTDPDAAAPVATAAPVHTEAGPQQREVVEWLVRTAADGSPLVRSETAVALARFASTHRSAFQVRLQFFAEPVPSLCHAMPCHVLSCTDQQRTLYNHIQVYTDVLPATGRDLGDAAAVSYTAGAGRSRSHTTSRPRKGRRRRRGCGSGVTQHTRIKCQRAVVPCGRQSVVRPIGLQQTHAGSRRRRTLVAAALAL